MQVNKKCIICGKEYYHCDKCERVNHWKSKFDTSTCFQIYDILDAYRGGVYSKQIATEKFKNIGITVNSNLNNLLPEVAKDIKAIICKTPTTKTKSK